MVVHIRILGSWIAGEFSKFVFIYTSKHSARSTKLKIVTRPKNIEVDKKNPFSGNSLCVELHAICF